MSETSIKDIPDYPAFKKLAAALWREDTSTNGAAVMIGSGFSRSAASNANPNQKMPLWNHFTNRVKRELGREENDQTTPLKLAEEYRVYFDQSTLNDLINEVINNDVWQPGELHKSLLQLGWSEVLTTNWDTLLEDAHKKIDLFHYGIVRKQSDLVSQSSPRITKLHGTIGFSEKYIVAEEDYRKYPQEFGIFVNFVRQVFIENELCLLGFSGDDPNFLEWIGWIRDNLQNQARKIYLVGAFNLSPSRRNYLESLNISPINLTPLVKHIDDEDARHKMATKLFLNSLENEQPEKNHDWQPTSLNQKFPDADHEKYAKDHQYAATCLAAQLPTLTKDRENYPGWLIPPIGIREDIRDQINSPRPSAENISELSKENEAKLLYEISWRYSITNEVLHDWLVDGLFNLVKGGRSAYLNEQQLADIALLLLNYTRWEETQNVKNEDIVQTAKNILSDKSVLFPDFKTEIIYYDALVARDNFDFITLKGIESQIEGQDTIWLLRRAAILAELGLWGKSKNLVQKAHQIYRREYKTSPNSIYLLSRMAWARYLLQQHVDFSDWNTLPKEPGNTSEHKCSKAPHIDHLTEQVIGLQKKHQKYTNPIEPSFTPGSYQDNGNNQSFRFGTPIVSLDGYTRKVGIPLFIEHYSILSQVAHGMCIYATDFENFTNRSHFILAIRAAHNYSDDIIKKQFSRTGIARTPQEIIDDLTPKLLGLLDYWIENFAETSTYAIQRIGIILEILSRLTVRLSTQYNKDIYLKALTLGHNSIIQNIYPEPLTNCLEHSLLAVPKSQHDKLLNETLYFPMRSEIKKDHHYWPNPVIKHLKEPIITGKTKARIAEIIDSLGSDDANSNTDALLRILPLYDKNLLDQQEKEQIAQKLWGKIPEYNHLPKTNLYYHVFLTLPSPESDKVKRRVMQALFDFKEDKALFNSINLKITSAASLSKKEPLYPSKDKAKELFTKLVKWQAKPEKDTFSLMNTDKFNREYLAKDIGQILSYSIVPALPQVDFSQENLNKLLELKQHFKTEKFASSALLEALVHFAIKDKSFRDISAQHILLSIAFEERDMYYPVNAILKWIDKQPGKTPPVLTELKNAIVDAVSPVRTEGLNYIIIGCIELAKGSFLTIKTFHV